MRNLRRVHLILGCLFAPLLIYYGVSGAWQTMGWHRPTKKHQEEIRSAYTELSNPHQHLALPYTSAKVNQSQPYRYFALAMALGISVTSVLGIVMAYRYFRPRWLVTLLVVAGFAIPILMLWSSVQVWGTGPA